MKFFRLSRQKSTSPVCLKLNPGNNIKLLLLTFLCILSGIISANEKISYAQFRDLVKKGGVIKNYTVLKDKNNECEFNYAKVNGDVVIMNCEFDKIIIVGLTVNGNLIFNKCTTKVKGANDFVFISLDVSGGMYFYDCCNKDTISKIEYHVSRLNDFYIDNNLKKVQDVFIDATTIDGHLWIEEEFPFALFLSNVMLKNPSDIFDFGSHPQYSMKGNWFNQKTYTNLGLLRCEFWGPVSFRNVNVLEKFDIYSCGFNRGVDLSSMKFPKEIASLDWNSIKGKLYAYPRVQPVVTNEYIGDVKYEMPHYSTHPALSNDTKFSSIANSYTTLINYFRSNNKKEEADYCYIQFRTIQKQMAWNECVLDKGNIRKIIKYLMLYLLGWYSAYSTDIYLAIVGTVKIILFFSFLYFIKNIIQNNKHFRYLFKNLYYFFRNFLTKNPVKPYSQKDLINYNKLKENFHCEFSSVYNFFMRVVIWGIVVSIITSINFFVTMGYGGLEIKGRTRYIAVFEGLVGWFFLILFTSCLITQFIDVK